MLKNLLLIAMMLSFNLASAEEYGQSLIDDTECDIPGCTHTNKISDELIEKYRVKQQNINLSKFKLNLNSHFLGQKYKTLIKSSLKLAKRSNFAGHYYVITWGCGDNCHMGVVVNLLNGKILPLPANADRGFGYQSNNKILVVNPKSFEFHGKKDQVAASHESEYYIFERDKFRKAAVENF